MREKEHGPAKNGRIEGGRSPWSLLLAGLALVTLLAAVSCGGATGEKSVKEPVEDEPRAEVERVQEIEKKEEPRTETDLENPSLGNEDAPVLMIEYADYQ